MSATERREDTRDNRVRKTETEKDTLDRVNELTRRLKQRKEREQRKEKSFTLYPKSIEITIQKNKDNKRYGSHIIANKHLI